MHLPALSQVAVISEDVISAVAVWIDSFSEGQ